MRFMVVSFMMLFMVSALVSVSSSKVFAQNSEAVQLPAPVQSLAQMGAQIRYLGRAHGYDGWIAIMSGREQYFYARQDAPEALLTGILFDKNGKNITVQQVAELQKREGATLGLFAGEAPVPQMGAESNLKKSVTELKTPAEQLYEEVESSNWVQLGDEGAPHIYSFIDPQCKHCHGFLNDLRGDALPNNKVQLRVIPVGFLSKSSKSQAAFLLGMPNPEDRFYRHLDGDAAALPVTGNINKQGVERNMSIMQSWKFNATPITIYKSKDGKVKIVQGRVKEIGKF